MWRKQLDGNARLQYARSQLRTHLLLSVPALPYRISFVAEKEQQADQRVAAAEARAQQAEEQLMNIAATLRFGPA